MFAGIARYFTRKRIEKENALRQKRFLSWDKVDKIALIIETHPSINKSAIDKFIEGTKKYMEVFFIETRSKQSSYGDWRCFVKNDRSFLRLPAEHVFRELKSKKYTLVINAAFDNSLYAANLTSALNADFKCGANDLYHEVDLIIERKEQELLPYLKDVMKYLEMIRTT
jgi:hypothetical protein